MKTPKTKPDEAFTAEMDSTQVAAAGTMVAERDWPEIDPSFLMGSRSVAPPLPLDAFPERLRETVSAIATARCINIDLVAASVIAIIAGATGNRVRLSITDRRTEPGALFVALVTEPGEGKTEALDVGREAFHAMQASGGANRRRRWALIMFWWRSSGSGTSKPGKRSREKALSRLTAPNAKPPRNGSFCWRKQPLRAFGTRWPRRPPAASLSRTSW